MILYCIGLVDTVTDICNTFIITVTGNQVHRPDQTVASVLLYIKSDQRLTFYRPSSNVLPFIDGINRVNLRDLKSYGRLLQHTHQ